MLMLLRTCPKCRMAFYMADDCFGLCPYCGYGMAERKADKPFEKRAYERIETDIDFTFLFYDIQKNAKVVDYSLSGARIVYHWNPIPVNSVIAMNLDELNFQKNAVAMWTKRLSLTMNSTGVNFLKNHGGRTHEVHKHL